MNTSINLQGKTQSELQALQSQIIFDYFADSTTDELRNEMDIVYKAVSTCLPHSFVLANLFDVEPMTLDIPDHVYESDPSLEWVTCPCCEGEKWLEVEGNGWTRALFSDPRKAYVYGALNSSYTPCTRCHGHGEVLEPHHTFDAVESFVPSLNPLPNVWLLAA
jgi:hypothetical protein